MSSNWTQDPSTPTSPLSPEEQAMEDRFLPLGEQLVQSGLLTPEELKSALSKQSSEQARLGEVLVELGIVEEQDLLPLIAQRLGVESVHLRDGLIDPQVVQLLPKQRAEALEAIVLLRVRDTLTVAMTEPQDLSRVDEIERITGFRVRPILTLRSAIGRVLKRCYEEDFAVDAVSADIKDDAVEMETESINLDTHHIQTLAEGSPVVNLVNYVIVHAVRQGASDIHIEPGHHHSLVRFRVDGQLRKVLRPRKDIHPALVSRVKVMSKLDIAEHRLPQDGRIHVIVEGREIDLRISTLPTVLGEKVVMRILDRQNVTFDLNRLGVPGHQLERIKRMLAMPHGLVLVTGPTGSGKTTTLYSALELIKSEHQNLITVEDPVEYQLELINQVQTGRTSPMTFANALRAILRQDPDVIMVGEIRDGETAEVAIQAALTGHLVLSTLHTNDSASAITRLLDMGVASYKISAAVVGVIAQRLVRNVCSECRTHYYPSAEAFRAIHYEGDQRRPFVRGEGCRECFDTGFRGRSGIYEVLNVTAELRKLINQEADLETIREAHREQGGTFLVEEGIRLAEEGVTNLDEVCRVALFD